MVIRVPCTTFCTGGLWLVLMLEHDSSRNVFSLALLRALIAIYLLRFHRRFGLQIVLACCDGGAYEGRESANGPVVESVSVTTI